MCSRGVINITSMIFQIVLLGFLALATAAKIEPSPPTLELPWGIWQATIYENDPLVKRTSSYLLYKER